MRSYHICLGLFLVVALTGAGSGQQIDDIKKGVVKVTAQTKGKVKMGTGFVVRIEKNAVYAVTASHVIEGSRSVDLEFFTDRNHFYPARVVGVEAADAQGLAVLMVEKAVPRDVVALQMDTASPVRGGDQVIMIGFPRIVGTQWAVTKGEVVGRRAKSIAFSGAVDEGNSGGPLISGNRVIGIVTGTIGNYAYACPSVISQYVLESWGVKFAKQLRSSPVRLQRSEISRMITEPDAFPHEYEAKNINGAEVVIDHATGLMWQQGSAREGTHNQAETGVQDLNNARYAGFTDWRLPTSEELISLLEAKAKTRYLFLDPIFDHTQGSYWTSDEVQQFYENGGHDWGHVLIVFSTRQWNADTYLKSNVRASFRAVRSVNALETRSGGSEAPTT